MTEPTPGPAAPVRPDTARTTRDLMRPLDDAQTALHAAIDAIRASSDAVADVQVAHRRADIAQAELDALRDGLREIGGDPTQVQNLYAQLASRTRQWKDAEARLDRIRQMADAWEQQLPDTIATAAAVDAIRTALDAEGVR